MLDVRRTVRSSAPNIPFEKIAHTVLGARFELSLVMCGDTLAQKMNKQYRNKTYKPNVLSFPLSKNEGEIFLNVRKAAREARRFQLSEKEWLAHLFVHGCFHLKGLDHGRIMEAHERRVLSAFGFSWHERYTPESTSARTTSRSSSLR